jgi:hypothetical protein
MALPFPRRRPYNRRRMVNGFLVPEKTVITAKGDGAPVEIGGAGNRVFLLTLRISKIVEQESMDLSIWGSADGANWGEKPLIAFPQKFYTGEHPLLLDLSAMADIKFLRAHWEVNRWGRGSEVPMFETTLLVREVPKEVLAAK